RPPPAARGDHAARVAEMIAEHAAAAEEFAATIGALTPEQWTARPAPETWSPAEITDHLARTYSQYAGEARGKNPLRIRLRLPFLLFARAFVKPRLLAGAPFPKAKAPRPLRPGTGPETPADGVALFRATGSACLRDLGLLAERRPYRQLVHPYLGSLPLYDMVRFAAQHIRHHHRQVLAALAAPPSKGASHVVAP
ncbi:MAG: DinB family protein, partial [Gemmatimonadaceae bacterium]|nr:DinB family protein [Gemmatimonadaceae bacterium]